MSPRAAPPVVPALLVAAIPALLVAVLLAFSTSPALASAAGARAAAGGSPRTSLPAVESQVMCVTCKIPLAVAQSPEATRERVFIQGLIDQGRSEAQIKRALVREYGPSVLALPSSHGFGLAAYLVPPLVLLALLALLALLLPRWRCRARTSTATTECGPSPPLNPADVARLDADMARFD